MSLQIRLPDRHQLISTRDGIALPEVTLVPGKDNLPWLCTIKVRIFGTPPQVAQLLEQSFTEYRYPEPRQLTGVATLPHATVRIEGLLPTNLDLKMQVLVEYHDTDPTTNRPLRPQKLLANDPSLKRAEKEATLYTEATCRVWTDTPELVVLDGGDPARLRILIANATTDARPVTLLSDATSLPHPELAQQLGDALRAIPQGVVVDHGRQTTRIVSTPTTQGGGLEVKRVSVNLIKAYELPIALKLSQPTRDSVLRVARDGIVHIPLVTEMPDGAHCYHVLRVEIKQTDFPGWLAIDFGTSNSTVTLCDQSTRPTIPTLPLEQEQRLRELMRRWLETSPSDALPGIPDQEWRAFLEDVGRNLQGRDGDHARKVFRESTGEALQEALKQFEISLGARPLNVQRAAYRKLQQIYHEALHVPPLQAFCMIPVELDATARQKEVPSEMEIKDLGPPLQVLMGYRAKQNRLQSIAQAPDEATLRAVQSAFYHSPKRYLGQKLIFPVKLGENQRTVTVSELVQSAWAHLKDLTEDFRQRNQQTLSRGPFRHVIITYPAAAPPPVRQEIRELVRALGFPQVQTDYDEAVSVAIFFLLREFGVSAEIGIEAFRARCRTIENRTYQNVLILDIGGGTTDVALLRLELREEVEGIWDPGEDRGAGGRYYVITPRLIGSDGELQLGGELISLRLFRLVKVMLADHLLGLVQADKLVCEKIKAVLQRLPDRFRVREGGPFRKDSLLEAIDNPDPEGHPDYREALEVAEWVLPTRWHDNPMNLQAFYALWELIDAPADPRPGGLKIAFSQRRDPDCEPPAPYLLTGERVLELLDKCGHEVTINEPRVLGLTITYDQFRQAVLPVIHFAVTMARELINTRLGNDRLDWLILSGKTCNMQLVHDELKRAFAHSDKFSWSPERITFEQEYAKLATSIGACYAEYLRRYVYSPRQAKDQLRAGKSQLYFNVKNLFSQLPCSFCLTNREEPLFTHGQQLHQIDADPLGKARTPEWLGVQLSLDVYRVNYSSAKRKFSGFYKTDLQLGHPLQWSPDELQRKLRVQVEIDNRLQIVLYFCQEGKPHYMPRVQGQPAVFRDVSPVLTDTRPTPPPPPRGSNRSAPVIQAVPLPEKLDWDIAVNVLEGQGAETAHIVFEQERPFGETFHIGEQVLKGMIGLLPRLPESGKFTLYARQNKGTWRRLCEIEPQRPDGSYDCEYRLTLDQSLVLGVHLGEVPYWRGTQPECLATPGCVFRDELRSDDRDMSQDRNPFCGRH